MTAANSLPLLDRFRGRWGHLFSLRDRNRAYRTMFSTPSGVNYALPDLLEFTNFLDPSPVRGDAFAQGRFQGRRDVMLHILEHLNLTPEEQYALIQRRGSPKQEDFDNG